MTEHSPGPWTFDNDTGRLTDASKEFVCRLEGQDRLCSRRCKANARLICSAPDLLNMLTMLSEKIARANAIQHSKGRILAEDWSELYQMTNAAKAIIARANGD